MRFMLILGLMLSFLTTGFTADRTEIDADSLTQKMKSETPPLLLDVRTQEEFNKGYISGAILIPHSEVEKRIDELGTDRDREIVVYCQSGGRAEKTEKLLRSKGFRNVNHLVGDWGKWLAEKRPYGKPATPERDPQ